MSDQPIDVRDIQDLYRAFEHADYILTKKYQCDLELCPVCNPSDAVLQTSKDKENFQLCHVKSIVYDAHENNLEKLTSVFNSVLPYPNTAIISLIIGKPQAVDLYMGIAYRDSVNTTERAKRYETFTATLKSNFPGIEIESVKVNGSNQITNKDIVANVFDHAQAVSSVNGIAALRRKEHISNEEFVQGIERLIDAMRGKRYSALWIADCISNAEIESICADYEDIYSQLSPFLQSQQTVGRSAGTTQTDSIIKGVTDTTNESVAHSVSHGVTKGTFKSHTVGGGIHFGPVSGDYHRGWGNNESSTDTEGKTTTTGTAKSLTEQNSVAKSLSDTNTESLQITFQNRAVKTLMDRIDEQIKRLRSCEDFGMYECGTYFIAEDVSKSVEAAATYQALMRGENSSSEVSVVNTWYGENAERIFAFLKGMYQPQIAIQDLSKESKLPAWLPVSPTSLVSGQELSLHIGLPKRSVAGLSVLTCAEFGREVCVFEPIKEQKRTMALGHIFHMRHKEDQSVCLLTDSLASHTFITGSTGAGKSNTIYHLLDELDKQDVRFLVVEPAKGEYKNVFGGRKNVAVYGTNRKKTELLQLNPFSFPEDTHVLEHIDRLVEIFNACWPMYAAMPAVLKDAVEQAYLRKGWDLTNSTCDPLLYPTFRDLMEVLPDVVKQSNYSADTQSDYIGSLYTRIKSLTNGINGQIFCSMSELAAEDLFDRNVIVDLSRVGSMETKALLMGVLVLKLQEHRMAMAGDKMNAELHHVTVLEEAHNLLRRTADIQTQESSNLQGKSVEMIANAIAEMRTYGEGFIIADQAPGLMDESVIRNTNTKIIMRLPDESDRVLVGKAASLNDDQIVELAKLPLGIAAVYQNDWLEPVLCKIKKFSSEDRWAYHHTESPRQINELAEKVCKYLLSGGKNSLELSKEDADRLSDWIASLDTATDLKKDMLKYLKSQQPIEENQTLYILYCIVKGKHLIENTDAMFDVVRRQKAVDQQIMDMLDLTEQTASEIRKQIFLYAAQEVQNDIDLHRELLYYGGVR